MNIFVFAFILIGTVLAEPPRYRAARFRVEAQEVTGVNHPDAAPYPAAGFRPTQEFNLPSRQSLSPPATAYGIPADSYNAPLNTYLSPHSEYGVPETPPQKEDIKEKKDDKKKAPKEVVKDVPKKVDLQKVEPPKTQAAKLETIKQETKPEATDKSKASKDEKPKSTSENLTENPKINAEVFSAQGAYYVLLPDYQLQRVQFQTENDIRNMAYTAHLQYKNEDRAPVYVYTAAAPQYKSSAYIQLI